MVSGLAATGTRTCVLIAVSLLLGCSSASDSVTCGAGTLREGSTCIPGPSTAAPSDAGTDGGSEASDGGVTDSGSNSPVAPAFKGVTAVAPASTSSLFVTWDPATDGATPAGLMRYAIYVQTSEQALDFTSPATLTPAGASSAYVDKLQSGVRYFVGVRAINQADLSDDNAVKKSAQTVRDTTAPTFAGVKSAASTGSGSVLLTWAAASDDLTPAPAISYLVYASEAPKAPDLTVPTLVTEPGALSATVDKLSDAQATYTFVVRARDAAENIDTNTAKASARAGADHLAPLFGGCRSAVTTSAGSALVSWAPASDETTPASEIGYDIYTSKTPGGQDFTAPPAATKKWDTSISVTNLAPDTTYYFVCRARDLADNRDDNHVERIATTSQDSVPPTFAGLTSATVDASARSVLLTWVAASDDKTPGGQIVYDVYEATSSHAQNFVAPPRATSLPGATGITVTDLTPDATLFWIVRARDQGGNHDANSVELSGVTAVSFRRNVQPIFTANCAVVGCHVPGNPTGGLVLSPGFAYTNIYNVPAGQFSTQMRVNPGDPATSYLYEKITLTTPPRGTQMPAPATGNVLTALDKDVVRRWILAGAVDN